MWKGVLTTKIKNEASSTCASFEVEMNYLDLLPNEILLQMLLEHLSPFWQIVCKSVCLRWHHLQPATRQVPYLGKKKYWFATEATCGGLAMAEAKVVPGMNGHATVLLEQAFWKCCNGLEAKAVPGITAQLLVPLLEVISNFCSGQEAKAVWSKDACSSAAVCHFEILQWLRNQGCPWDEKTCSSAAAGGHLEVLQWARSQGRPWDEETYMCAAMRGRLEVLQWARSQGCP